MGDIVVKRVAVVATGVIGSSWAAYFLAHGLDVVATDPAPGAEAKLRATVNKHWPILERFGLTPGARQNASLLRQTWRQLSQVPISFKRTDRSAKTSRSPCLSGSMRCCQLT